MSALLKSVPKSYIYIHAYVCMCVLHIHANEHAHWYVWVNIIVILIAVAQNTKPLYRMVGHPLFNWSIISLVSDCCGCECPQVCLGA